MVMSCTGTHADPRTQDFGPVAKRVQSLSPYVVSCVDVALISSLGSNVTVLAFTYLRVIHQRFHQLFSFPCDEWHRTAPWYSVQLYANSVVSLSYKRLFT